MNSHIVWSNRLWLLVLAFGSLNLKAFTSWFVALALKSNYYLILLNADIILRLLVGRLDIYLRLQLLCN